MSLRFFRFRPFFQDLPGQLPETPILTGTLMRSIRDIENTGPERRIVPTANLAMTHNPYQPWLCGGNKVAAGEKK